MDNSHPLCTPMVVRLLDIDKSFFRPSEIVEELLTNYTCPDIEFVVNLLTNIYFFTCKKYIRLE